MWGAALTGQAVAALTRGRLSGGFGGAEGTPSTAERCAASERDAVEEPVLLALNAERARSGEAPVPRLTVHHLKVRMRTCPLPFFNVYDLTGTTSPVAHIALRASVKGMSHARQAVKSTGGTASGTACMAMGQSACRVSVQAAQALKNQPFLPSCPYFMVVHANSPSHASNRCAFPSTGAPAREADPRAALAGRRQEARGAHP